MDSVVISKSDGIAPSAVDQKAPEARNPVAVAASLLATLQGHELASLGAHENLAVAELGGYAEETLLDLDAVTDVPERTAAANKARLAVEIDDYLRTTLGHERFNQLSFLAAARAAERNRTTDAYQQIR